MHPEDPGDLFPETRPRGKTRAPDHLSPPQIRHIHAWAERTVPWVSRGAFDSFTTIEAHIEEVLEWWAGAGRMRTSWTSTIQNRIRRVERDRLTRMARSGSEDAKLALRDPTEWARRYDRKARAVNSIGASGGDPLIRPAGGSVIHIAPQRRGSR